MRRMGLAVRWRHGVDHQIAPAGVIEQSPIQTRKSISVNFTRQLERHIGFNFGAKLKRHQLSCPHPNAMADIISGHDQIIAFVIYAP